MKPLHVLLVSPVGEVGGAEQVLLALAKRLPDYGVQPSLACLRPGPLMEKAAQLGLPVSAFQEHRIRELGKVIGGIRWLTKLVRKVQPDMIHSSHAAHLYSGPASRMTGVPELWHIHDYPYKPDLIDRLQWRISCQRVLFTTERVKSGYPQLSAGPHSVVAPTCVDPAVLQTTPIDPDIRRKHGLPEGPLFMTVARLQEHKGHRYLIDAIPEVLKSCPNAIFAIVGKANGREQESYRDSLRALCEKLGIAKSVRLLGYVADPDLYSLYRSATALVHPALSEGFGLTLLEAMAMGLPVIAAAADGPRELITQGQNGWLVPIADSESLSAAIIKLVSDAGTQEALSRGGREFAAVMSVDRMVKQTVDVYRQMSERRDNSVE